MNPTPSWRLHGIPSRSIATWESKPWNGPLRSMKAAAAHLIGVPEQDLGIAGQTGESFLLWTTNGVDDALDRFARTPSTATACERDPHDARTISADLSACRMLASYGFDPVALARLILHGFEIVFRDDAPTPEPDDRPSLPAEPPTVHIDGDPWGQAPHELPPPFSIRFECGIPLAPGISLHAGPAEVEIEMWENAVQIPETLIAHLRGRPLSELVSHPILDADSRRISRIGRHAAGPVDCLLVTLVPMPGRLGSASRQIAASLHEGEAA